jgi:hypothetical protein
MTLRHGTAALAILLATTTWAQSGRASAGPLASRRQTIMASSNTDGLAPAARNRTVASQQMQEMGATLAKMHELLKGMRAKASANEKDPMAKANLDMWSLMLQQLDKQYEELRLASRARQDLDARRNALYKQADEKGAAAAKAALEARAAAVRQAATSGKPAEAPSPNQTTATPSTSSSSPN